MNISCRPIAYVRSVFKEKFGTPRQPGLVPSAKATLIFEPPYDKPEALRGIEAFSHLWLIFVFHENQDAGWHPTVRPPRLGGNTRLGVFATRSPFRPNPLGLSLVKLESVEISASPPLLHISGADLIDGTPILDIKPYIPSTESIPDASAGFVDATPWQNLEVTWAPGIRQTLPSSAITLIEETLALNPKPAFHHDPTRLYGMSIDDYNIRWTQTDSVAHIVECLPMSS